jgi:hypothetical protein
MNASQTVTHLFFFLVMLGYNFLTFCFVVMGIELRTLRMLSKSCPVELHLSTKFLTFLVSLQKAEQIIDLLIFLSKAF